MKDNVPVELIDLMRPEGIMNYSEIESIDKGCRFLTINLNENNIQIKVLEGQNPIQSRFTQVA